jgi:hypothetical protein
MFVEPVQNSRSLPLPTPRRPSYLYLDQLGASYFERRASIGIRSKRLQICAEARLADLALVVMHLRDARPKSAAGWMLPDQKSRPLHYRSSP